MDQKQLGTIYERPVANTTCMEITLSEGLTNGYYCCWLLLFKLKLKYYNRISCPFATSGIYAVLNLSLPPVPKLPFLWGTEYKLSYLNFENDYSRVREYQS